MNSGAREPLRARFDQQKNANAEARLETLLDNMTAAAHVVNVCALNLQSAAAIQRRVRLWLAVGITTGLGLGVLASPFLPW